MTDLFDKLQKETEQDISELKVVKFVPTTYHDVEFELQLEHYIWRTYDNGLAMLRRRGYDRHPRSFEIFTLLADSLEGKLSLEFEFVAKNITGWWWEWLSLAWERKGNLLIAYLDPEGLMWNGERKEYVKKDFHYTSEHHFDITDKKSNMWILLREFSDDFIEFHYGRKYHALPPKIREMAIIRLPSDGVLWPAGCNGNWCGIGGSWASRGVKMKQVQKLPVAKRRHIFK